MKPYSDSDKQKLQKNLALIRKLAGWTSADLGELIGVTDKLEFTIKPWSFILIKEL